MDTRVHSWRRVEHLPCGPNGGREEDEKKDLRDSLKPARVFVTDLHEQVEGIRWLAVDGLLGLFTLEGGCNNWKSLHLHAVEGDTEPRLARHIQSFLFWDTVSGPKGRSSVDLSWLTVIPHASEHCFTQILTLSIPPGSLTQRNVGERDDDKSVKAPDLGSE